jgi:DNA-binding beta-propeller fold protein YncE
VTIVDPEELKIVGDIPLDPNPSYVLMGPQNRFLYVLYNGAFNLTGKAIEDVSEVAILDTASRTWVKRIPVGWRVYKMLFWKDDRSLVCFSIGRSGSKKLEEEPSLATAIDTRTNEVAATFTGKKYGIEYEIIMDPENWTGE